jgi:hypothetical protein
MPRAAIIVGSGMLAIANMYGGVQGRFTPPPTVVVRGAGELAAMVGEQRAAIIRRERRQALRFMSVSV